MPARPDRVDESIYGGISVEDNTTETTIESMGTAAQITIFDTNETSKDSTPDHTNGHITIKFKGTYMITCCATINSITGAGSKFEMTVTKNNGASVIIPHIDRNVGGGGAESGVIAMCGMAALDPADTVEVWIENETNAQNYVVENISLILMKVGD